MSRKPVCSQRTLTQGIRALTKLVTVTAVIMTFGLNEARAGFPAPPGLPGLPGPNVNVHVNGFLPAPPGVNVMIDSGRPYYVERDRRVYMEREKPAKRYKNKKYKKHHDDNGRGNGHGKH